MGVLYNGKLYIQLFNPNEFKKKSFNDNVYFTLRDIFLNADCEECIIANNFNGELTNHIPLEERTDTFEYTDVLHQKTYCKSLLDFLQYLTRNCFYFDKLEDYLEDVEMEEADFRKEINKKYMEFDDWWVQFQALVHTIDCHVCETWK